MPFVVGQCSHCSTHQVVQESKSCKLRCKVCDGTSPLRPLGRSDSASSLQPLVAALNAGRAHQPPPESNDTAASNSMDEPADAWAQLDGDTTASHAVHLSSSKWSSFISLQQDSEGHSAGPLWFEQSDRLARGASSKWQ